MISLHIEKDKEETESYSTFLKHDYLLTKHHDVCHLDFKSVTTLKQPIKNTKLILVAYNVASCPT